jgi:hypothetical protein
MSTRCSNSTTVQELAIRVTSSRDAEKTRKACCGMDQTDTVIAGSALWKGRKTRQSCGTRRSRC